MSLYREVGAARRSIAAGALVALVAGLAVGFGIGRGTAPEPALSEQLAEARASIRPALSGLELVSIEYPEAVRGTEIVAETEYEAARAQASTAVDLVSRAGELEAVDPEGHAAALAATGEVADAVEAVEEPRAVEEAVARASDAVERLAGDPPSG